MTTSTDRPASNIGRLKNGAYAILRLTDDAWDNLNADPEINPAAAARNVLRHVFDTTTPKPAATKRHNLPISHELWEEAADRAEIIYGDRKFAARVMADALNNHAG